MWSRFGHALDATCATAWWIGFRISGLGATAPRKWHSPGGARVLVVAPHPDDEVAGCGGTILLHREAGDHVTVLQVTDGRGSRALGLSPDAMAIRRRAEAGASMGVADVNRWEWLGLREGEWSDADLTRPFENLLRELAPHVIYLPSRVDFHQEHYRVARVVACSPALLASRDAIIRIYQVQVPLTRALVNVVAPIAHVFPRARRAFEQYVSQEESLRGPLRLKGYAAAAYGFADAAEEFWELRPDEYSFLHAEEPPRPLAETFRAFRRLAMTDPLALARGRTERRRLQSLSRRGSSR